MDETGRSAVQGRGGTVCRDLHQADAEAIARAPEDIDWLLGEVRHLQRINAQLRSELGIEEEEVGTSREGDITLARFKIEKPTDD